MTSAQRFGNVKMNEVYLATVDRGRTFVMDFDRWGMAGAQPRFQVRLDGPGSGIVRKLSELQGSANGAKMIGTHRSDFVGIGHPDAELIASAPTDLRLALEYIDRLETACKETGATECEFFFDPYNCDNIPDPEGDDKRCEPACGGCRVRRLLDGATGGTAEKLLAGEGE